MNGNKGKLRRARGQGLGVASEGWGFLRHRSITPDLGRLSSKVMSKELYVKFAAARIA